ncbi:RidA family protein [Nonomuraea sp. H19]|uniref:RidA family protein n=1 Tax=Nonomuraea sp. H19 TaxID=3452206 RepID=UPI003F8AF7B9
MRTSRLFRPAGQGDLAAQAEQAFRNVGTALDAAGASQDDIARLTVYVVDLDLEKMDQAMRGIARVTTPGRTAPTAWPLTMVGGGLLPWLLHRQDPA